MAKLDLNTTDGLKRLMNEMNNIISKKIETVQISEGINNIDNLSFLNCKQIFESVTDKLYETEKGKKLIKKYTNTIKENKVLRSIYTISEMIKNNKSSKIDNPTLFVNEAVKLVGELNNKNLKSGINSVKKIVKEAVSLSGVKIDHLNNSIEENKMLNESIDYIFMNKKQANNLIEYSNNMNKVVDYVSENVKNSNEDVIEETTYNDLKNLFSNDLKQWENVVIEKIVMSNMAGESKKGIFEDYKSSCLNLISETLEDEDITMETKSRLSSMKTKLEEKEYIEESADVDILKLADLENTLKN